MKKRWVLQEFNKLDLNVLYIDIKPKILLLYNTRLQMISWTVDYVDITKKKMLFCVIFVGYVFVDILIYILEKRYSLDV